MREMGASMKLTDENQDDMDCRPLNPNTGIATRRSRWSRLSAAIAFALEIHADQTRKGAETPYIGHLLGVASLVLEHGGDEEQAMAGMLHDAIEDQGQHQEAAITERFGARVARIVRACTDADTMPKPPWRARKEAYVRHLEDANADVLLVSAADKLHNARAILTDLRTHGLAVFERFTGRIDGTLWYYEALAEVFGRRLPGALASELLESTKAVRRATEALRSGAPR
jgi:(p)ppGpp synthase/HD superfamily hydrolase